jgi:hypothetical protein
MKIRLVRSFALVGFLLAVCGPLFGHHGNVAYDMSKPLVLKEATVTKFTWANPHSFIMFDAKDGKGNAQHWIAETGSPSSLTQIGWNRNSLQPKDILTVYIFPSKSGVPVGRLNKVVFADNKELRDSIVGYDSK